MRVPALILAVGLGLSLEVASAHQDRIVTLQDDGTLLGIPAEFGPGELQLTFSTSLNQKSWVPPVSSVVLTLGKNRTELSECVTRLFNSTSLDDLLISASWYHDESHLPYYLHIRFLDPGYASRDEAPGFRLLFNLRTAELISLQVMIFEHGSTIGRDLPVDLKALCGVTAANAGDR